MGTSCLLLILPHCLLQGQLSLSLWCILIGSDHHMLISLVLFLRLEVLFDSLFTLSITVQ